MVKFCSRALAMNKLATRACWGKLLAHSGSQQGVQFVWTSNSVYSIWQEMHSTTAQLSEPFPTFLSLCQNENRVNNMMVDVPVFYWISVWWRSWSQTERRVSVYRLWCTRHAAELLKWPEAKNQCRQRNALWLHVCVCVCVGGVSCYSCQRECPVNNALLRPGWRGIPANAHNVCV